eukprot:SM000035S13091  [mRNA]  locus=s35:311242:319427:- [translate_table: standard]
MLEDWEASDGRGGDDDGGGGGRHAGSHGGLGAPGGSGRSFAEDAAGIKAAPALRPEQSPIFGVEMLERDAAQGHGLVTCAAAGNNTVVVGTSLGWLARFDFSTGEARDISLSHSRGSSDSPAVRHIFLDPSGRHTIAALAGGEAVYVHARWTAGRPISRLKGLNLNAIAWHRQQASDVSTREIVAATEEGQLLELLIEEREKREKYVRLLYEPAGENREPFSDVQMETTGTAPNLRYFVMAVTPTRLYVFTGVGTLEVYNSDLAIVKGLIDQAVFTPYSTQLPRYTELPSTYNASELHFFGKARRRPEQFAWLAGPGILHGHLTLSPISASTGIEEFAYVESKWLLEYSKLEDIAVASDEHSSPTCTTNSRPLSLAVTEYHFLLLFPNKLKVVNRVNQAVVEVEVFGARLEVGPKGMLGLTEDPAAGTVYAFSETSLYEISSTDEARNMWRVHLLRKEYAAALSHCRSDAQRDQVNLAQAEEAFAQGDYDRAASFYAKIGSSATFEEITLKFIAVQAQDALRNFLLYKLDHLAKEDRTQITMVATWTVELYLDKINYILLQSVELQKKYGVGPAKEVVAEDIQDGLKHEEYNKLVQEFRAFLSDNRDALDEATTMMLLSSYGRNEELLYFASLREQHEFVVRTHIQNHDAKKALATLRRPRVPVELQYAFAPQLITLDPQGTIDAWVAAGALLDPRRLMPALIRDTSSLKGGDVEIVRYLEYCVRKLRSEDPAIHNLLLSLYAKREDEAALLQFLGSVPGGAGVEGEPKYDTKLALRLCMEHKRVRACAHIYSFMGMHREAVSLALKVDLELAKKEVRKVEGDEELRKKLWLMIAKFVTEQGGNKDVKMAVDLLHETDGLLHIEDILPFFPEFTLIDDFKEAVCESLERYKEQIEELKGEMAAATRCADAIRADIAALARRHAVIHEDDTCSICTKPLIGTSGLGGEWPSQLAPFYAFPCGHSFHSSCLTTHVLQHSTSSEREVIERLKQDLIKLLEISKGTSSKDKPGQGPEISSQKEQIRTGLDQAVASECPFCGELMVREIGEPFVGLEEKDVAKKWELRTPPAPTVR